MTRTWIATLVGIALSGCTASIGDGADIARGEDGLLLRTSSPERVSGSFSRDGAEVVFDSRRVDDRVTVTVRAGSGELLVQVDDDGTQIEQSYLGGRFVLVVDKDKLAEEVARSADPDAPSVEGLYTSRGDEAVLDELLNRPEYAQLPWLSRALGARGLTGNAYGATLALHWMGKQAARGLGIDVPALDAPADTEVAYCRAYPNSGNQCYGMCGPGCSCWSWVCGNCCYWSSCATHDNWCRQGKWWLCYSPAAIAALGCRL
jgi:hypothetical protein